MLSLRIKDGELPVALSSSRPILNCQSPPDISIYRYHSNPWNTHAHPTHKLLEEDLQIQMRRQTESFVFLPLSRLSTNV